MGIVNQFDKRFLNAVRNGIKFLRGEFVEISRDDVLRFFNKKLDRIGCIKLLL